MIIEDSSLYNYLLCSKKYEYENKKWEPNKRLKVLEALLNKIHLTKDLNLPEVHFSVCSDLGFDYLFHIDNLRKTENLFSKLKLWNLSLVSGPQSSIYTYGKVKYNININTLFITNKGALRGLCLSPYSFRKDIVWNAVHRMQYEFLKDIYTAKGKVAGQTAKMYFVGAGSNGYVLNSIEKNLPKNSWLKEIEYISNDLKNKRFWPLSPCPYFKCEFRSKCFPENQ